MFGFEVAAKTINSVNINGILGLTAWHLVIIALYGMVWLGPWGVLNCFCANFLSDASLRSECDVNAEAQDAGLDG